MHVGHGGLSKDGLAALHAADPDMLLLVGGTDGGNADVLVHAAEGARREWLGDSGRGCRKYRCG